MDNEKRYHLQPQGSQRRMQLQTIYCCHRKEVDYGQSIKVGGKKNVKNLTSRYFGGQRGRQVWRR